MSAFTWSPDVVPLALSSSLYLSLSLFPPSFFLLFFYSQSARRSLNWSAFRRQSKSNQTLPRIPTISVFCRIADNSGFTALLKISMNQRWHNGNWSKERYIDIKRDKPVLLVFLLHKVRISRITLRAFYRFIWINNLMTFSFHQANRLWSRILTKWKHHPGFTTDSEQSINFLLTNFGRYAHEMKFYVFNAMRLKCLFSTSFKKRLS